jgi:hypothetical protein
VNYWFEIIGESQRPDIGCGFTAEREKGLG